MYVVYCRYFVLVSLTVCWLGLSTVAKTEGLITGCFRLSEFR